MKIFHLTSLKLHFEVKNDHVVNRWSQVIPLWGEMENYRLTLNSFTQVHRKLSSAVRKMKDPRVGGSQHVVKSGTSASVCPLVFHQHDLSESKFSSGDDSIVCPRLQPQNVFHCLQRAYLWYLPCGSQRGKHTDVTQWCQAPETFASPSNSGGTLSSNSFHALVVSVSVNWAGSEEPSRPSSRSLLLAVIFFTLRCLLASLSSCWSSSPQFRALVIFCLSPLNIYLSSSHSILCLCLFNTRRSCLPSIGCLRCDAERFPIDGMERHREREWRL